jgi:uncharacterized protein with ParB-like and HNH nuclease domain
MQDDLIGNLDIFTGAEEDIEDNSSSSKDDKPSKPFNPSELRLDNKLLTIDLLLKRIEEGELDLKPTFQRKSGIWKAKEQSRLIESLLVRIPIPAFYIDATDDEKWLVVDGQQRLTSLKNFIIDKSLKLCELEFLGELENKIYSELSRSLQRRLLESQVIVYLIQEGTDPEVKFTIFRRINTGGLPLSPQEIRHALYQGKATSLLEKLADSEEFKQATSKSIRDMRMTDREFILRFLAFTIFNYKEYKIKNLDDLLNRAMYKINLMSHQQILDLEKCFQNAMKASVDLFDKYAFRKRYNINDPRTYPINKALFEVWAVNLGRLNNEEIQTLKLRKEILNTKFVDLMLQKGDNNAITFEGSITQNTGSTTQVNKRFSCIERIIWETLSC